MDDERMEETMAKIYNRAKRVGEREKMNIKQAMKTRNKKRKKNRGFFKKKVYASTCIRSINLYLYKEIYVYTYKPV